MVFSGAEVWNIICFLYRHKSSNRAQRTYQTSPEEINQEQKEDQVFIYLYIEASQLPASLYMCDPSILLVHQPHQISQPLATGQIIFIVDFPHRESKYSQRSSLVQKIFAAAMVSVHFLLFYVSLKGDQTDQPSLYPFEREVDQLFCHNLLLC